MTVPPFITLLINFIAGAPPGGVPAHQVDGLEIARATVYFGALEDGGEVGDPTKERYFLKPALMARQRELRQALLKNWLDGGPPLTLEGVYTLARGIAGGDPGTALLICHNVLKSMARGSALLPWNRVADAGAAAPARQVSRLRPAGSSGPVRDDDYTDGNLFYRPVKIHAAGQVVTTSSGKPSIWHLLFDPASLTSSDPGGDWYHFFLMATVGLYAGHPGNRLEDSLDPEQPYLEEGQKAWGVVSAMMQGTNRWDGYEDSLSSMAPARRAWVWANAMSFIEGSVFGSETRRANPSSPPTPAEQADVQRESEVHLRGLLFGLQLANPGFASEAGFNNWRWYVPVAGTLQSINATANTMAKGLFLANMFDIGPGIGPEFTAGALTNPLGMFVPYSNLPQPIPPGIAAPGP